MRKKKYTKEFLISELHRFVKEFGHVPNGREIDNTTGYVSCSTFVRTFGSWKNALISAKLDPQHPIHRETVYSEDFLISELYRFIDEYHRIPKYEEIGPSIGFPSSSTYERRFGSWNSALKFAGIEINREALYTKEFLISELHRFVIEFGFIPLFDELNMASGYPSTGPYRSQFGSWNNALIAADLKLNKESSYTKETLISELHRFVDEFGQIPKIEIPSFDFLKPTRPELVEIPTELVAALKTMAINMSKMDGYISQLEIYCKNVNDYIAQLQIILTTKSDNKYIQRK